MQLHLGVGGIFAQIHNGYRRGAGLLALQRNGPSAASHVSPHIGILERHRVIGTGRRSLTRAASLPGAQLAP